MKIAKLMLLSLLMVFCSIPLLVHGETVSMDYFVSVSNGNDNNVGSYEMPFKSIKKALSIVEPGNNIYILAGIYSETLNITRSGQEGKMITIKNYGNDKVIIDGNGRDAAGVSILNKSYIRIEGIEITNFRGTNTPMGISIEGAGSNIEIVKNKIYNIQTTDNAHGIAVYGTSGTNSYKNILIDGNEVYQLKLGQSESIVVNGNVEEFKIINNIVHDNDNIGIDCIGFEGTAPANDQARNGIVKNNLVYNISSANNPTYGGDKCADGIYVDGGKGILIEGNRVYNCDLGIEVASEHRDKITNEVNVKNNIVYECDFGFVIGGADNSSGYADNCYFINNTLYNNNIGIAMQKTKINIFHNNIIQGNELIEGNIGSNIFSNNLWYTQNGEFSMIGTDSKFMAARFVDERSYDFNLLNDSPAIDMGILTYINESDKDFAGNARIINGKVDCGAYEYKNFEDNIVDETIDNGTDDVAPEEPEEEIVDDGTGDVAPEEPGEEIIDDGTGAVNPDETEDENQHSRRKHYRRSNEEIIKYLWKIRNRLWEYFVIAFNKR